MQGVTVLNSGIWCYTVLTQCYRVLQGGTGRHTVVQNGVTRCYRVLHGVTRI